jgi:hypothetical protein
MVRPQGDGGGGHLADGIGKYSLDMELNFRPLPFYQQFRFSPAKCMGLNNEIFLIPSG